MVDPGGLLADVVPDGPDELGPGFPATRSTVLEVRPHTSTRKGVSAATRGSSTEWARHPNALRDGLTRTFDLEARGGS